MGALSALGTKIVTLAPLVSKETIVYWPNTLPVGIAKVATGVTPGLPLTLQTTSVIRLGTATGGIAVGTSLVVYGGYKLYEKSKSKF